MARVSRTCLELVNALSERCDPTAIAKVKEECLTSKYGFRNARRVGPVSEKQRAWREKFKAFAAQCKGTADYRACMREKLRRR